MRRDTKSRKGRRVGAKYKKSDALVINPDESQYSEFMKAMRSDVKLVDLGAGVRSIRDTRSGEVILEIKRAKTSEGVEMRAFTA